MDSEDEERILSLFKNGKYPEDYKEPLKKALLFLNEKRSKNTEKIIEIAKYLLKKDPEKETMIAALLFLDYESKDEKEIKEIFGKGVQSILSEEKKLSEVILKSKEEKSEIAREVILSSVEDMRAIILRLVFKLSEMNLTKEKELAKEVIENYIPLANRLGFEGIKKDLANSAFKILNPKKYSEIENFLKMSEKGREKYIREIIAKFEKELKKEIKNFKIKGREKQIISIYEKIVKRKVPLNKQKDQFGVRIIAKDIEDCYKTFEIITKIHHIIENTFKDYIKDPKENGYQSIHFCIKDGEKIIEIQFRTKEMDELAEEGAAAHWTYKKIKGNEKFEKKTAWLKEILKLKEKKSSIFEGIKLNLFRDKIYCYTPKGKMISLSSGATALDFAYHIHVEIGNHSVGALVNSKFLPLKTELKSGDTVEILTNKFQRPRRDWLKFINTKYAKKVIAKEIKKIEDIPVPRIQKSLNGKEEGTEVSAIIKDFPNHIISFAKCCNPLPKDEIIGILKSYRRALIHCKGCEKIEKSKKGEINAEWKEILSKPVKIFAGTTDRSGILADLINTISRKGFKIKEANAKLTGNTFAECYFVVYAQNLENLEEIIRRMKKIKGVRKVWLE